MPNEGMPDLWRPWGERLRWWRVEHMRLSQRELADKLKQEANSERGSRYVNPDEKLIRTWESGQTKRGPQAVYRRALARLGAPLPSDSAPASPYASVLTAKPPVATADIGQLSHDDEDMDRRDFLRAAATSAAGTGALAFAEPWERLASALGGRTQLDVASLAQLDATTLDLFNAEEHMPAVRVVGAVTAHLDRVGTLLGSAGDDETRRRLTGQAGTTAALAGWLAFDRGAFEVAGRYYDVAARAADDAADPVLAACIATYRSYVASATGRPQDAVRHLTQALDVLPRGSQPAMTAWLSGRLAEESAAIGDHATAARYFDRAFAAQDFISDDERPVWTRFFTPTRLDGMAVAVYARTNHPDMDAVAQRLAGSVDPTSSKVGSIALADLSCAYLERGDVEQGAVFGQKRSTPSGRPTPASAMNASPSLTARSGRTATRAPL